MSAQRPRVCRAARWAVQDRFRHAPSPGPRFALGRRMRIAYLLAALLVACGAPPAPAAPISLRVATWNVHDLFDEVDRLAPPGADDLVRSPEEVEAKLDRVGEVLVRVDADVVFLQEVENLALLERLGARAGYPEARLVEGRDPRGIDVGALSRLPVLAYVSHRDDLAVDGSWLWSRDCVEVHADAGGLRLIVVGTHLVSRLYDEDARRTEQAARMREIADDVAARFPDAVVLAGGDLNDLPGSAALAPIFAGSAWSDPAASLPEDAAWTWTGENARERIDYLLGGRGDTGVSLHPWVAAGAEVGAASDHRPAVLDLTVP